METEMLSEKELAELTGYKAKGYQRRWLNERSWHFVESRGSRPLAGRRYARLKLGGTELDFMPVTPPPCLPWHGHLIFPESPSAFTVASAPS